MAETTGPIGNGVSSADGGVQSLERAFLLLERMADAGGEVGAVRAGRRAAACRCRRSTGWCAPWSPAATSGSCPTGATPSARG